MATKTKVKKDQAEAVTPAAVIGQGNPGIGAVDTGNLMAALQGLQSTSAPVAAGKSKDPNVVVDGSEAAKYIQALKDKKDAEGRLEVSFSKLAPQLEKARIELSRKFGKYLDSLDVNSVLKYIMPHRYKTIVATEKGVPTKEMVALQSSFGTQFSKYFSTGVEIKVKTSAFETLTKGQQVALVTGLTKLCAEIGVNPFEIKPTIVPTEALSHERVMDPIVEATFMGATEAGLVVPIKATLREAGK